MLSVYKYVKNEKPSEFLVAIGEDQLRDYQEFILNMKDELLDKIAVNQSCVIGFLILTQSLELSESMDHLPPPLKAIVNHSTHHWGFSIHHYSVEHGNDEYQLKDNFSDKGIESFSYVYQVVQRFKTMHAKHLKDVGHIQRIERLVDCSHTEAVEYYNWSRGLRYVFEMNVIKEVFEGFRREDLLEAWNEFPGPNLGIRDWVLKYPYFEGIPHNRLYTINAIIKLRNNQPLVTEAGQAFYEKARGSHTRQKAVELPYKATTLGSIWPTQG